MRKTLTDVDLLGQNSFVCYKETKHLPIYLKIFLFLETIEGEDSDTESETQMTEVRFIPEDRGLLEAMFHAMSVCQTLHPDPNDSVSDGILDNI